MKMPNGIKAVIPVSYQEEKTNKALIDYFQSDQNPDATPATYIKVFKAPDPDPDQPLIGSLQDRFTDTPLKLQSIIQKQNDSIQ